MSANNNNIKLMVVVPAYNEEQAILQKVVKDILSLQYNVVVVDDGSSIPVSLQKHHKLVVLRHIINLGQGAALQTGFDFANKNKADIVVTFDADGQHQATDIEKLAAPLIKKEADVCLGSRFLQEPSINITKGRILTLKIARVINYFFTGIMLSDAHNGLRAFSLQALQKICLTENRMSHATEMIIQIRRTGLRYKEIPVSVLYTAYSKRKGQPAIGGIRIFLDLLLNKFFE